IWDFAVFLLVPNAPIKDKAGVGVRGNAVAQVGTDQRSVNDLSHAVCDVHVPNLQFIDRPAVVKANPSFGFAFSSNGLFHVCPEWHVLRSERPPSKRLFDMKSLPVSLELIAVAVLTQIVPHILDRYIQSALE